MNVFRDGLEVMPADIGAGWLSAKQPQALLEERLSRPLVRLFAELTGLPLHVFWHQPRAAHPKDSPVVLCPAARQMSDAGARSTIACQACLKRQWHSLALGASDGQRFLGRCAATNLCLGIEAAAWRVLSLVLHAHIRNGCPESRKPPPPGRPAHVAVRGRGISECRVTAEAFDRAESLLRLVLHDLQTTLDAHRADSVPSTSPHRLKPPMAADPHRPDEPAGRFPEGSATETSIHLPGGRAGRIVEAMLDYIRLHYQHPMALKEVATCLGMNANYLSGLFHRSLGTTFHHYLDRVRMARAEELLHNPRARICDISKAVGYASPNHFRSVFKVHKGSSPTVWAKIPTAVETSTIDRKVEDIPAAARGESDGLNPSVVLSVQGGDLASS